MATRSRSIAIAFLGRESGQILRAGRGEASYQSECAPITVAISRSAAPRAIRSGGNSTIAHIARANPVPRRAPVHRYFTGIVSWNCDSGSAITFVTNAALASCGSMIEIAQRNPEWAGVAS